jgi:hypothetical protein|uniref:ORF74 n=1 Tax=Oryza sativa subsp. japonica TaxID=39947 RepID=Q35301_ORYSJ|nr:ORF74 [Oryza sativa Japonica Group]
MTFTDLSIVRYNERAGSKGRVFDGPTTSPASLLSGRKQAGPDGRASPATQAAWFATTREAKDSRVKAEKTSIVV